ncbi:MAG TPA: cytochrome c [Sphingomicrobium sp.]|jgi:cytochrome c556
MRIAFLATTLPLALLAACGGPQESQANDAQANISMGQRVPATATSTDLSAMTGAAVSKEEAKLAMHERHESMEKIGKASKAVRRELESDTPNLGAIRQSASTIAEQSKYTASQFPKGSGPDVGKTGAKPEIWANAQDFTAKTANFQQAAQAFNQAAGGNDIAAIKKSFADLGGTCKACHDKYRAEMKH